MFDGCGENERRPVGIDMVLVCLNDALCAANVIGDSPFDTTGQPGIISGLLQFIIRHGEPAALDSVVVGLSKYAHGLEFSDDFFGVVVRERAQIQTVVAITIH